MDADAFTGPVLLLVLAVILLAFAWYDLHGRIVDLGARVAVLEAQYAGLLEAQAAAFEGRDG